ncbi:MAG: hypothetical protein A2W01_01645 [Candidatus Solincola sediminis]|uniref:Oleate hydratase n=1 Tax=Candidatus Solincola sediminis TaxID=1797199 RepID=A0A1F2WKC4_9ACTN|nr:MAG: hypothetical protein A2Y75_07665 [Candidatus Solincola sediminis]OFW58843.1 MAG: hypothetical protein A2W01_01645 [Candidatus Solincola sediminis]
MENNAVTDKTQVYIVGGGIAGLASAAFAIRDGNIPGKNIHIFEVMNTLGGALDGAGTPQAYICRGARKYNYPAFNCTWNLLATIPSLSDPEKTVMKEIVEYNKLNPKNVQTRIIDKNMNRDYVKNWGPEQSDVPDVIKLMSTPEKMIEDRKISDWFRPSFFSSNFWIVYCSMFGFEPWHCVIEMKRYLLRFRHDGYRTVQGGGEVSTPYNQYDSMILPIRRWLEDRDVNFKMGCKVTDLGFKPSADELTIDRIHYIGNGKKEEVALNEGDIVIATIGSIVADSRSGSMTEPARLERGKLDGSWTLWENIIKSVKEQRSSIDGDEMIEPTELGNPSVFCDHIDETKWVVFSVTATDRKFLELFEEFTGNKDGQADLVTFKDSPWLMSIHMPAQPQFPDQPDDVLFWMGYGLIQNKEGDYVKKKMADCNGGEILTEICNQFGFTDELPHIRNTSTCIPTMNPYDTAHFMPRKNSDRPRVVPEGSTNLAFVGQYVEIPDECVMLVESSIRSAQTAVYTLLNVDKMVPPIHGLQQEVEDSGS